MHHGAGYDCPFTYSAANNDNPIPLHRWAEREVTKCPDIEPSLNNLQHLVAGKLLDFFQQEIRQFNSITQRLSSSITVNEDNHQHPAVVAREAIQKDATALAQAYDQGHQAQAVHLAEEFMSTLPDRLTDIKSSTSSSSLPSSSWGMNRQLKTLLVWLNALEALSHGDKLNTSCDEVKALENHPASKSLNLSRLFTLCSDISNRLMTIYSCPYSDYSVYIKNIKIQIETFCKHSNLLPRESFNELTTILDNWHSQRMYRIQRDKPYHPLAAAHFYSAALSRINRRETITYMGLLLGMTLQDIEYIFDQSTQEARTAILFQALTQMPQKQGQMDLQRFQQEIINALCQCSELRLASTLARDWELPQPLPPSNDALERFYSLGPDDIVPLELAFQLLGDTFHSFYDMGVALGLTIPDINDMVTDTSSSQLCRLRLLNQISPVTRQYIENCMLLPAAKQTGSEMAETLQTIARQRGEYLQWQPSLVSAGNNGPACALHAEHIRLMAPDEDWFSLGYLLGVPFYTLESIKIDHSKHGPTSCFYQMLSHLADQRSITIGQLVSIAQKEGFGHTVQHLPNNCQIPMGEAVPATKFPLIHDQLAASLLTGHADQWKTVAQFFGLSNQNISAIKYMAKKSDKEKLIRVLDKVYNQIASDRLENRFQELVAHLQPPQDTQDVSDMEF